MVEGLVPILLAFRAPERWFPVFMILTLGLAAVSGAWSWVLYRQDPDPVLPL